MKIGAFVPFASPIATPAYLHAAGPAVEERGFHSFWAAEHVVLFDEYASKYPYAADGRIPAGGEVGFLDPFSSLSFVAATTERLRLGTGICLVPQRNPVYTAKEVANLDWVSGGRFDFGVGVGWLAEEMEACATPYERRGARCRSYLNVMMSLWTEDVSSYQDDFYTLPECRQYPKPVQTPHPPIHFGGESDAALRRVADMGQGWYTFNRTPDELPERLGTLDRLLSERGRSRADVQVSVSPYMKPLGDGALEQYAELGVDQVILLVVAGGLDELRATLDDLTKRFVEPAARL